MKNKVFTGKQKITMLICTIIIILVCVFLYNKNNELINAHPEYSVYGVSEERRDSAEELFNNIISTEYVKISDDRIYELSNIRKDVLFGNINDDIKLLSAIEVARVNNSSDNVLIENDVVVNYINNKDIKQIYMDLYGEEISNFVDVSNEFYSYVYKELNDVYYIQNNDNNMYDNIKYYVYYDNYNSPYEHPDKATVDVHILAVKPDVINDGLYSVSNLYGDIIKNHLNKNEVLAFVKTTSNYQDGIMVKYNFNNNLKYGLTFESVNR